MLEQVGARANASSRMLVRMRPNTTEERSPSSSSYIWHCVHTCRAPVQTLPNCCSERCARARMRAHKRTAHTARSPERACETRACVEGSVANRVLGVAVARKVPLSPPPRAVSPSPGARVKGVCTCHVQKARMQTPIMPMIP